MKCLIACEESQEVTKAFRALGHEAWSCDLQDCSGGHPEWHIKDDVLKVLSHGWDMMIAFPPCTDLAVSGARWFKEKRETGDQQRSINFFLQLALCGIERVAIENPIGIMSTHFRKPDQIIQPWQFGHGETKATCLWLRNLPILEPMEIVEGREQRIWKMPPSKDRAKNRSKTFPGIAKAMAEQWGSLEIKKAV
jgi:site-specific DNA-cytosine methylase